MEVLKVAVVLAESTVSPLVGGRLAALARKHQVPAAQLAVHHAGQTLAVEVGEAEHGTRRRIDRDAAVPIGSITKCFTATTAMVLVADGDLELDAPIADHLPELGALGEELTLRQLLSHTGGLPSGPDSEDVSTATVQRYLADHCRERSLVLPPGTGFSYSNMGFVVVGQLIATITGMSWWEAVTSIVLQPLGIEPAAIAGPGRSATERLVAAGHSVNAAAGRVRPVRQALAPAEAAAGALAMSAVDLVELGRLHLDPDRIRLLPQSYAAQMRRPVPEAEPFGLADGWGLGLAVFDTDEVRWVGHDGNADGTACYLRVDPVGGWVVALTSNANTGLGLWQDLLAELAGTELPVSPPRVPYPPSQVVAPSPGCAGTYANGELEHEVVVRGGVAYLSVDGAAFTRLTCHDGLVFSLRDPASGRQVVGGRFVRDPYGGRIQALQMAGRLASRRTRAAADTAHRRIA
jgi:CubicO group peptidase (beta-lactamase class C family)